MSEVNSKHQILKSTAIFGSAQVVIILVGVIRTKILALLLGPLGIGISGIYQSTIDLIRTATGFGLGYSGVRDIAAAASSGEVGKVSTVITVLRRWAWATGILGLVFTILLSKQLSRAAFGDRSHAVEISFLSVVLLFSALTSAQSALLQGLRQITKMAKATIWSALGSLVSVSIIYYIWGFKGIIPAIIIVAAIEFVITWFYFARIKTQPVRLSVSKSFTEGKNMAKIGFFMTLSVLCSTVTMYIVRSFIAREAGLNSVGYFVAAWTISSIYISAIFSAMGADYFPRLATVQADNEKMKIMVNEQTEISLLLTTPIIIATINFISWILPVFYSKEFNETTGILTWQLVGDFFKTLSWPLGFVLLARGKGIIFLLTEVLWNIFFISFVYWGWESIGITTTGIGFLTAYIIYLLVVYVIVSRLVVFKWTVAVWRIILFSLPVLCLSVLAEKYLNGVARLCCGIVLTTSVVSYSFFHLRHQLNVNKILGRLGVNKQ